MEGPDGGARWRGLLGGALFGGALFGGVLTPRELVEDPGGQGCLTLRPAGWCLLPMNTYRFLAVGPVESEHGPCGPFGRRIFPEVYQVAEVRCQYCDERVGEVHLIRTHMDIFGRWHFGTKELWQPIAGDLENGFELGTMSYLWEALEVLGQVHLVSLHDEWTAHRVFESALAQGVFDVQEELPYGADGFTPVELAEM